MRAPVPAAAVLAEFRRRSQPYNAGRPMAVILDEAKALGGRVGHTSRVRFVPGGPDAGGKALVVYLHRTFSSLPYAICHEVAHNILYADGLTRLAKPFGATKQDTQLISQISTSTSHPLVTKTLESFGWPVIAYEAGRAEWFLRAVAGGALSEHAAALIAAEFTVTLGHYWLHGARPALRRVSPYVEAMAVDLLRDIEACLISVEATEAARRRIVSRFLYGVELRGVNPLERVAGPGSPVFCGDG